MRIRILINEKKFNHFVLFQILSNIINIKLFIFKSKLTFWYRYKDNCIKKYTY